MTIVALVRHGPVRLAPGFCYGRSDIAPLVDPEGTKRIVAALTHAAAGGRWAALVTSPARRCRVLADSLADALGLVTRPDDRLQELDFGHWEGLAWSAVPRAALDRWAADPMGFSPPGGETGRALIARVGAVAHEIAAAGRPCIVVSHGGPLRLLGALLRDEPPDLLAPTPAIGSVSVVQLASKLSTAHSVTISVAPSTSPV